MVDALRREAKDVPASGEFEQWRHIAKLHRMIRDREIRISRG
jgi:hypothetical protein